MIIDETLHIVASRKWSDNSEARYTRPLPPPRSRENVIFEPSGLRPLEGSPPVDDTMAARVAQKIPEQSINTGDEQFSLDLATSKHRESVQTSDTSINLVLP